MRSSPLWTFWRRWTTCSMEMIFSWTRLRISCAISSLCKFVLTLFLRHGLICLSKIRVQWGFLLAAQGQSISSHMRPLVIKRSSSHSDLAHRSSSASSNILPVHMSSLSAINILTRHCGMHYYGTPCHEPSTVMTRHCKPWSTMLIHMWRLCTIRTTLCL